MNTQAFLILWAVCTIASMIFTMIGDDAPILNYIAIAICIINLNIWTAAIRIEEKLEQSK